MLGLMGVEFKGRRILDIGCGTGIYGLALAGRARSVLGLDSSAAMLAIFRAERRRRGLSNAACAASSWAAIPSSRLAGRFDLAIASMTMAIKSEANLLKMEKSAPCRVYIGWAGVRRNPLLERVYARHGVKYQAPEGAAAVLKILKRLGREPAVRYIRDSWERRASLDDTMRDIEVGLKVNGARMDREWVESLLKKMARKGTVRQVTSVRKALIVWRDKPCASGAQ